MFTPFWRKCRGLPMAPPVVMPEIHFGKWPPDIKPADQLRDWQLLPTRPDWAHGWEQQWQPGARGAQLRLDEFLLTIARARQATAFYCDIAWRRTLAGLAVPSVAGQKLLAADTMVAFTTS